MEKGGERKEERAAATTTISLAFFCCSWSRPPLRRALDCVLQILLEGDIAYERKLVGRRREETDGKTAPFFTPPRTFHELLTLHFLRCLPTFFLFCSRFALCGTSSSMLCSSHSVFALEAARRKGDGFCNPLFEHASECPAVVMTIVRCLPGD